MITIKQPNKSSSCVLACAAMICGKTISQIESEFGLCSTSNIAVGLKDLANILNHHGKFIGLFINWEQPTVISPTQITHLEVHCVLSEHDAILTIIGGVASVNYHAVVWDSQSRIVRDPLPHIPETTSLEQYMVKQWLPITDISNTGW